MRPMENIFFVLTDQKDKITNVLFNIHVRKRLDYVEAKLTTAKK